MGIKAGFPEDGQPPQHPPVYREDVIRSRHGKVMGVSLCGRKTTGDFVGRG